MHSKLDVETNKDIKFEDNFYVKYYDETKLEGININVSTTNTNMHSKLDVETNKDIKFEDNFYVKYYDETKVDKFSLQLYLNVWKDIKSSDITLMSYGQ
jgi:hypothetical protein